MAGSSEWFGLALVCAAVFCACALVVQSKLPNSLKILLLAALLLRVAGAGLRYSVLMGFYDGSGDARMYYRVGLEYAEQFAQLDFSALTNAEGWRNGRWWGTQFVYLPAALVVGVIGPTLVGAFVVFAMFALLGLVAFLVAFRRTSPEIPAVRYGRWLLLFPSLWYWPSSLGKEALLMLGLGVAVLGYVGARNRLSWGLLLGGTSLIFAIRPQVAGVLLASMICAHWIGAGREWNVVRAAQALSVLIVGLVGIHLSMTSVGIDSFDVEGVHEYVETSPARRVGGGSAIDAVDVAWSGIPVALLNILARPFIWEAHNPMVLFSSVEIVAFWLIVAFKRRNVMAALRSWRQHRLLRLALPFIVLYSVSLGLMVTNLGIISRQRVLLFPFAFLFLEVVPYLRERERSVTEGPSDAAEDASVPEPAVA